MVSRLGDEVTVVGPTALAPPGGDTQGGFRLIEVEGAFALDSVGGVASVAGPLAAAGISLFAFSVWSTDAFLVQAADVERAMRALADANLTIAPA